MINITAHFKCTNIKVSRYEIPVWFQLLSLMFERCGITHIRQTQDYSYRWTLLTAAKCHKNGQYTITRRAKNITYNLKLYNRAQLQPLLLIFKHINGLNHIHVTLKISAITGYLLNLCDNHRTTRIPHIIYLLRSFYSSLFHSFVTYFINHFFTGNDIYSLRTQNVSFNTATYRTSRSWC